MRILIIAAILCAVCPPGWTQAARMRVITVSPDGSGDTRTIQGALDAISADRSELTIIDVRNGDYNEKIYITKSNVAIVGENRERTRIYFAELRSAWNAAHNGDDWGSGVINIGKGAHDVILANLSVRNTYGDTAATHDHQFTIRGFDATRISLLYCNVTSAGGDAVSLWNRDSGMYYHAYCSFEGWVDYVCPRGWCYITNSQFFGFNRPSASIWHDGSANEDQKFVIRRSVFDGVPGFPLGRHHRDAQFYLLDCVFSENMADRPLYAPTSPNTVPWVWGSRHYFWNCSRVGGDYPWFANNLETAKDAPEETDITPRWTFAGTWDPETTLPSVLPFAAIPCPDSGEYGISPTGSTLAWIPARGAESHIVHFGEREGVVNHTPMLGSTFNTGPLRAGTTYEWAVTTIRGTKQTPGPVWSFTTADR